MATFDRQKLKKSPRLALRVTDHAMLRFRERVEEAFVHRSDDDLADLLNKRLRDALLVRDVKDPRAPDLVTSLYLFECRADKRQVAVVREGWVVTVLDEWMARNNYPGWDGEPRATFGSMLADKLRAVVPVPSPPATPTPSPLPASPSDEYLALAAECRELAAKVRAARAQKEILEGRLQVVTSEIQRDEEAFASKRERLLALMTDDPENPGERT